MTGRWLFGGLGRTAAQWFVRLRAQPVTPRVDAKFQRWLAGNPANEVAYERHELAWELAGELAGDPEIEALLADAQGTRQQARTRPRHTFAWSAIAASLMVAIALGIYWQWPSEAPVYTTALGEQRTVMLPDRSRMILNTGTRARVVFDKGLRGIELEYGEATFSVTHDASRPFEVRAAHGTARALGTEFNVLSAGGNITVAVLSGKVEVVAPAAGTGAKSALLNGGQEVSFDRAGLSSIKPANAARINAWHSGRVAFDNVSLEEALREFNRYGMTPIVLGDPSLATVRVSGVFRIGKTDALLEALHTAFDIETEQRAGAIELHSARGPAPALQHPQ